MRAENERDSAPAPLPASVEAAIAGMSAIPRGQDGEGQQRTLLHFNGESICAWHHSPEETRRRIAHAWPALDGAQQEQVYRAISGKVAVASAGGMQPRPRSSWASWSPARKSIF